MRPSYYRVQQDLVEMIESVLDVRLSVDEAFEKMHQLHLLMLNAESKSMEDLYEIGNQFSNWLNDQDIRDKDAEYGKVTTDRLRIWCEKNAHRNF